MSEIFDLHLQHGSIKAYPKYKHAHYYLRSVYPMFFEPRRATTAKILEVGVAKGGSLRAMRDYFPNAKLVGIDIENHLEGDLSRITFVQGSQNDVEFMTSVANEHGPFDFIIEDGSHLFDDQLITTQCMLPALKVGGIYFVEDVNLNNEGEKLFEHVKEYYVRWKMNQYSVFFFPWLLAFQRNT